MFFRPILPLKCLTHGELYERNLLFKQTRRSKSESISRRQVSVEFAAEDEEIELEVEQNVDISAILTDWKFSQLNSPNADLTYFFLSSTSQNMRDKYTQDWLEQYYFSFTECLRAKFGVKLTNEFPEFDFDVFCKDFKANIYKAYLQVSFITPFLIQGFSRDLECLRVTLRSGVNHSDSSNDLGHIHAKFSPNSESKISQKSVRNQSKISQSSVQIQSKISQKSVKNQSKISQKSVKMQSKCSQNSVKIQSKYQSKIRQKSVKLEPTFSQNSIKIQSVLGVLIQMWT